MAVRSEINIREAISVLGYVLQDDSPITVHATRMVETPVTLCDEQNEPIDPIHGMFSFVPLRLVLEQTLKERL